MTITLTGNKNPASEGWYFYFDFLECAVLSAVPDAPATVTNAGLSCDFDTGNTYQLSPERLIWNLQKLGLVGEIDHYCGVFWWNQRTQVGAYFPNATLTFGGTLGRSAFRSVLHSGARPFQRHQRLCHRPAC